MSVSELKSTWNSICVSFTWAPSTEYRGCPHPTAACLDVDAWAGYLSPRSLLFLFCISLLVLIARGKLWQRTQQNSKLSLERRVCERVALGNEVPQTLLRWLISGVSDSGIKPFSVFVLASESNPSFQVNKGLTWLSWMALANWCISTSICPSTTPFPGRGLKGGLSSLSSSEYFFFF